MKLPFEINSRGKLIEKISSQTIQQQIISQYINSQAGRAQLAAAMIQPLRRRLNYAGIARQCFPVQQLPSGGASVYYPEDKVFGEKVTIPEFEIYENPTIKISEVKRRRFNIIDHGRKKLFINTSGKLVHEPL
jgi:hypothetical protein